MREETTEAAMEAHDENQPARALKQVLFIANESLRIHTALVDHSAFHRRHGIQFSQALKAALLRALYSIKGDFNFVKKLTSNQALREFVGLPTVDWACHLDILAHDMDLFLADERIRGLLLAIIETARASGLLSTPGFLVDQSLIIAWITDSYRHGSTWCEEPAPVYQVLEKSVPPPVRRLPPKAVPPPPPWPVGSPYFGGGGITMHQLVARPTANLTERQFDVLRHLVQGQSNKRIASELGITEGTVKIHLAAIFKALNVKNRTEAAVTAKAMPNMAGMA